MCGLFTLLVASCNPPQDGSHSADDALVVDSGTEELTLDLSTPPPASDAGDSIEDQSDEPPREIREEDEREDDASEDVPGCLLECPEECEFNALECTCECPELECNPLGMEACQEAEGCVFEQNACPGCCDGGEDDCLCDCEGACVPEECPDFEACGAHCTVEFGTDGCAQCICEGPESCGDYDEYCGCRDDVRCQAFMMGPTCGNDCECDGLACGCPSGTFVTCMRTACPVPEPTCPLDRGCEWEIGGDGCVSCSCDPPKPCEEIEDYCECADQRGCEVVANQDCGYTCECLLEGLCDCAGTEFLGCQRETCEAVPEDCDVESGACELEYDDRGCAKCSCEGGDDDCAGLSYCACDGNSECEVLSSDCMCPCDYECPGYEDCECDCGGGEYLGCQAKD